jgi:hypothetical protein
VKLEKVGKYLQKKNAADLSRNRTGNVQVTLEIVDGLIKKCLDDVNVFAENVNAILLSVLSSNDLSLCQHAGLVYNTFCKTLDGELFTGDLEFVDGFNKVTNGFFQLGIKQQPANPTEWKAIALKAVQGFASSKLIVMGKSHPMLQYAIPLVLNEIKHDYSTENILKRTSSHSSSQHELSRFNTVRTSRFEESETPQEVKTDELAMSALKTFFSTNSAIQINVSTRAVAEHLTSSNVDQEWGAAVTEMTTHWIPVQLRFLVLSVLLSQLEKDKSHQVPVLNNISSLLSSSVNLVGLSVIDHLRQLLDLQLEVKNSQELINSYSQTIGSLATHIYYQEQIIDMVGELLVNLKEAVKKSSKGMILMLLDNIKNVIVIANKSTTVQRHKVPLELFSETFQLLTFVDNKYTGAENYTIQMQYMDVLNTVLELEYISTPDFSKPDHDNLITDAKRSVINQLYEAIEQCSNLVTYGSFPSLMKLIDLTTEKFGVNAIVNALPCLFQWQLQDRFSTDVSKIIKDNLGFYIVYAAAKSLQLENALDEILARIDYRKANSLWRISEEIPKEKSTKPAAFSLTKGEFENFTQVTKLDGYQDMMFSTHYRYKVTAEDPDDVTNDEQNETSFMSQNAPQNISLSMFVQPQNLFCGENNSIRSAPLSARSVMMGKLSIPKVQELRKAISGGSKVGKSSFNGTAASTNQKTDVVSLLNDLSFDTDCDGRGSLTFRR